MTEFIYTLTDERVKMKNNMNNVFEGHHIIVCSDDMMHTLSGIVSKVTHRISQYHNGNGLERSSHDLIIEIEPEP